MGKGLRMGVALLAMLGATAASAAVLVVRSSGPSAKLYPPGKALGETQTVELKATDTLVLLDSRGTRTLRGPGTFSVSASAAAKMSENRSGGRMVRMGTTRGVPLGVTNGRNVWQADIARGGNVCVADAASFGLYRGSTAKAVQVAINQEGTTKQGAVEFAAGEAVAAWPAALPLTAGSRYRLKASGAPAVTMAVRMLSPVPQGMESTAQAFITNDCQAQLDLLIDTFTAPGAN